MSLIALLEQKKNSILETIRLDFTPLKLHIDLDGKTHAYGYAGFELTKSDLTTLFVSRQIELILSQDSENKWVIDNISTFENAPYFVDDIYEDEDHITKAQSLLEQYIAIEKITNYQAILIASIYSELSSINNKAETYHI